jgi:hypothetical protein
MMLVFISGVVLGLYLGKFFTELKWAKNAKDCFGIELNGNVYKVITDKQYCEDILHIEKKEKLDDK